MVTQRQIILTRKTRVRLAWHKACAYDKVDPSSSFVVFSDNNPHEKIYNQEVADYLQACKDFEDNKKSIPVW